MTEFSALYMGRVMHQRLQPKRHALRYNVFWLAIDLDELDLLPRRLKWFSRNRFNIFSLCDRDYGDGTTPKQWAERQLGETGLKIQLVTMPRLFGYAFNPISIYYCRSEDGALKAILYEVHNTFGERHTYVFSGDGAARLHGCGKAFHVSPFLDMEMNYTFRTALPDDRLSLEIIARHGEQPTLTALMVGRRKALTDSNLLQALMAMPLLTFKVTAAIHWHALLLWLKGLRLYHKPAPPANTASMNYSGK